MSRKKMILVEAEAEYDYDDCYDANIRITQAETISEIVRLLGNDIASDYNAMQELIKNQRLVEQLDKLGFRQIDKIKDIEEKIRAEKRFFIWRNNQKMRFGGYGGFEEVNVDNMERRHAESLAAEDTMLLQSISKASLKKVSNKAYTVMNNAKKRIEAATAARKANVAKRQAKKREKELEAARKLLAEAEKEKKK